MKYDPTYLTIEEKNHLRAWAERQAIDGDWSSIYFAVMDYLDKLGDIETDYLLRQQSVGWSEIYARANRAKREC